MILIMLRVTIVILTTLIHIHSLQWNIERSKKQMMELLRKVYREKKMSKTIFPLALQSSILWCSHTGTKDPGEQFASYTHSHHVYNYSHHWSRQSVMYSIIGPKLTYSAYNCEDIIYNIMAFVVPVIKYILLKCFTIQARSYE